MLESPRRARRTLQNAESHILLPHIWHIAYNPTTTNPMLPPGRVVALALSVTRAI